MFFIRTNLVKRAKSGNPLGSVVYLVPLYLYVALSSLSSLSIEKLGAKDCKS